MDKFFPFRGYRYDPTKAGEPETLVTQPYDKISSEMLESYLQRSPYNVAHVIKNPDYGQAGRRFAGWIQSGVLKQDPDASLYPYQQEFELEGRRRRRLGVIGLVSLEGAQQGVKGHESVLRAPLEDRLQLIRRTESNDGLIFSLYSDPSEQLDRILQNFCSRQDPVTDVVDDYGTRHTLWRLSDPERVQNICRAFRDWTLYIADGHHRFETALQFARECREKRWQPAAVESYDKRMMALFNLESKGISILPTHRAVRDLPEFQSEAFIQDLKGSFEVTPLQDVDRLSEALKRSGRALGLVVSEPFSVFLLRPRSRLPQPFESLGSSARSLDVNLLHRGILEPSLGIGDAEIRSQKHVDYFRDRQEMIEGIRQGRHQLGFVLNPTRLEQVREISERGEKMPQKSTDFYPKLLTGLVFMKMEIAKPAS